MELFYINYQTMMASRTSKTSASSRNLSMVMFCCVTLSCLKNRWKLEMVMANGSQNILQKYKLNQYFKKCGWDTATCQKSVCEATRQHEVVQAMLDFHQHHHPLKSWPLWALPVLPHRQMTSSSEAFLARSGKARGSRYKLNPIKQWFCAGLPEHTIDFVHGGFFTKWSTS